MFNWHQSRSICAGLGWLVLLTIIFAVSLAGSWSLRLAAQSGITSPAPGAAVNGDVPIFGTAQIEPFQKYELHYKLEPSGDDAYIYFGGNTTPVTNGQLGVWQAGGLAPGVYSLRLRVVKTDGNYAEFYIPNLSVNQDAAPTPSPSGLTPTPTPIPTMTFTPAPQPTAVVGAVQQPQVEGSAPLPTNTPAAVAAVDSANDLTTTGAAASQPITLGVQTSATVIDASEGSVTRELGEALAFERLREQFWNGVRYSIVLCFGVLALFGGKRLLDWVWTQFR